MSETSLLFDASTRQGVSNGVRTILIVDDNRDFAELLATALDLAGGLRCVGIAGTAAEGLRLASVLKPEMVIMDLQMPGEDGLCATRGIRQALPETLVAVLSAHGTAEWVALAADAGAHAFIVKDGRLPEMIAALRRVHRGSVLRAAAGPREPQPVPGRREPDRKQDVVRPASVETGSRQKARDPETSGHQPRELARSLQSRLRRATRRRS
jgi:DNA-binding NarL/FixJ family response regulator